MTATTRSRLLPALVLALGLGAVLAACGSATASGNGGGGTTTTSGSTTTTGGSSDGSTTTQPSTTTTQASTTTTTVVTDDLPQPSVAHPLVMLEIGDSLGEDLGFGLGALYASDPYVHVVQDAVGDTGLANIAYYNWQLKLGTELRQVHPGVVVVFLGGNDGQNFWASDGQYAAFGNAVWHQAYSARVGALMSEATAAGARVLWVGMPIMQDPSFWGEMQMENAVYFAEASAHPGVTYFASWPVFADAQGQYVGSVTGTGGEQVVLRDPDGIHLTDGGDSRLALALVAPMEKAWEIQLFPAGTAPAGS